MRKKVRWYKADKLKKLTNSHPCKEQAIYRQEFTIIINKKTKKNSHHPLWLDSESRKNMISNIKKKKKSDFITVQ